MARTRRLTSGLAMLLAGALLVPAGAGAAPTPLSGFGSLGTGAGQLVVPQDVAVDASGSVYVSDTGNARIDVFTPAGVFIHAFGSGVDTGVPGFEVCTTASGCLAGSFGTEAAALGEANGLALDGQGNLYVADSVNDRISVFGTNPPSFLRAFGFGVRTGASAFEVCTTATGCQAGLPGDEAGSINSPIGLALSEAGELYVADSQNERISAFEANPPTFLRAFGFGVATGAAEFEVCTTASGCEQGQSGGEAGQLGGPESLELAGLTTLHVVEALNQRVSIFNTQTPSFTRAFGYGVATGTAALEGCTTASSCQAGVSGTAAGQLDSPMGVALDGLGSLHVSEPGNLRISTFSATAPLFTHSFGWGVDTGAAAFEVCTTASVCQLGLSGGGLGQMSLPRGLAADCRGAVWLAEQDNNRVERFGEPGTALPPCPATPVNPPSSTPVSPPTPKKCKKAKRKGKAAAAKKKCKRKRKRK